MHQIKQAITISIANCILQLCTVAGFTQPPRVADSLKDASPQRINTILKTNPFTVLWGAIPFTSEFRIVAEYTTSIKQASQVGLSYLGKSPVLKLFEDSTEELKLLIVRGVRFQVSHKFYIKDSPSDYNQSSYLEFAPRGFYISPHLSYATAKFTTKYFNSRDVFIRGIHFNINLLAGYQLIIWELMAIDIFAGLGYKNNTWIIQEDPQNPMPIDTSDLPPIYNIPVKFTLGFNLGYAF